MTEVYTIDQLRQAWKSYKTLKVMKVLKGGSWYLRNADTKLESGITEAHVVTCDKVMSFITYLEKYSG